MKTLIQSIVFLATMCVMVACSNQSNKNAQGATEANQSKIINGMVTSIENGKDGYTANVQTKASGDYAALVSIVNLSGPDNFVQFKVGDNVTLKGTTYTLGDIQQLKVEKIITHRAVPSEKVDNQQNQTKVVNGRVTAMENGKDGYTATIQSDSEGLVNALVSIVNLGGPDNYVRFNIGDRVSVSGTAYQLGEVEQLKVEEIISVETGKTQLLITSTSFRGITTGDKITGHMDYLQKDQLKNGEGTFDIYRIKDFNNNPAGYLMADPKDNSLVGDIIVESPMAQTVEAIKIGSSFQDLTTAIPTVEVNGSEIEGRTYATYDNISYRLDVANFSYEVDKTKVPATAKVIEIVINRGYEDLTALNTRYNQVEPNEFCWQVNKVLDLYTKPNTNSLVQGKHFQGETLKVLGSQIIDDQLWVNVEFQLSIKAGYEDQFADGQVMSSGVPTGWIGGAEAPIINCK